MRSPARQRLLDVIAKGIFGIFLASMTIYLIWYEFGLGIFEQPIFTMLIGMWAMYGVVIFLGRLDKAREKTEGEKLDELTMKLDELIEAIKNMMEGRNEQINKSK